MTDWAQSHPVRFAAVALAVGVLLAPLTIPAMGWVVWAVAAIGEAVG